MAKFGMQTDAMTDDQIRDAIDQRHADFRDKAPMSAGQAATVILDGVRNGTWRILVGDDARTLDRFVRSAPEEAYEADFARRIADAGHLGGVSPDLENEAP